jgi:hypothetical protein
MSAPIAALERLRVVLLAGVATGVLVGGIGGRLAMLVLRLTSPHSVVGVTSDDGFEIGQITLGGTYNLLLVGAGFGVLGAALHGLVAPWLIGPRWFRHLTVALGSGAVVGGMLVHTDGVDFTTLEPTWLAIACFVAIPALFGGLVGVLLERCGRADAWSGTGWRRRALPVVAVACFPLVVFPVVVVGAVFLAWSPLRARDTARRVHAYIPARTAVQGAWLLVAVVGLASLLGDVQALT